MAFCPHCGAEVKDTDVFCKSCGGMQGGSEPRARVDEAYPALRIRRLRRAGSQRYGRPTTGKKAQPGSPLPDGPSHPHEAPQDMEAATIISRPGFSDLEPEAYPSKGQEKEAVGGHGRGRYQALEPRGPQGEPRPGAPGPPGLRVRTGVPAKSSAKQRTGRWDKAGSGGSERDPEVEEAIIPQDVQARYAGLGQRGPHPEGDPRSPVEERSRLISPRRSDVGRKPGPASDEDDALMAEIARGYSREYLGREGWNAGAIWDSVRYTFRMAGKRAARPLAARRLRRERTARERIRQDQLTDLGELALGLRELENEPLEGFRDRFLEIQQEEEMREEELEEERRRLEDAERAFAEAERKHALQEEEEGAELAGLQDQLRPEEAAYRGALKKAQAADEDARAIAQQMDRAQSELRTLSQRPGSGQEVARLRARVDRWSSERDALLAEAPRLAAMADDLLPRIDQLRKEVARAKQNLRDHREAWAQREAEHRRERNRLGQEMERLGVAKEGLAGKRRALWLECGRQLDIDRPSHDHLEESYQALDRIGIEIRRIDEEIAIATAPPGPHNYDAFIRAGVALSVGLLLFILILLAVA